ncbi:unnamed protein product [Strongylus vulgaris]|uniref:Uncharacterized protein n=1 Tax=Strongylus vulgaris TaxID=40348 RepID=A0A3P7JWD2_STRVU|nr:unnamed protein product [Strongylus vulgaris]
MWTFTEQSMFQMRRYSSEYRPSMGADFWGESLAPNGFLLDRLAFDHSYTIRLWHIGAVTTAYTSYEFRTPQCLKLVKDPALCAPPPVSDISWSWNSTENEGNRIVLTWIYGSPTQMIEDGSRVERRDSIQPIVTAFPRMVHFDIAVNPLVTASQYQCQFLDGQRRVVTWVSCDPIFSKMKWLAIWEISV